MARPVKLTAYQARKLVDRLPRGIMVNALPAYYLVVRDDGELWLMWDKSKGEGTGDQVCLATIDAETVSVLRESSHPLPLQVPHVDA